MEQKKWYKSKTKLGGFLIGLSALIGTAGGMMMGTIETTTGIQSLIIEVGAVLAWFGVRDLPFIND